MELTLQSQHEYDKLRSGEMTPAMAAEYLRDGKIRTRGFAETLRQLCPEGSLQARITAALQEDEPGANPESVARRVRNWLSGQNQPVNREDIFRIAFALGLGEGDASLLLGLCTGYGIHYRDGRDVVYAWFLRMGRSYAQARDFFATLPPVPRPDSPPETVSSQLTHELQNLFLRAQTQEDLRDCYIASLDKLGALHMRAYFYFEKYLDQLVRPAPAWGGLREPDYSMEAIMRQYFSLHMPSGRNRQGYSVAQKLIKQNWPNATALKNIRQHKEDVTRKLLLLLYVVTENVVDGEYHEIDEEYVSAQERLEDHWWTLNAILNDCGMPALDLRNSFDWLVVYAITAEDEAMSERMERVIDELFSDVR